MDDASAKFDNIGIELARLNAEIAHVSDLLNQVASQQAQLVTSHNQVGENVAWLVANTQGIFQMLNSPDFMNQMMGSMLSGGLPGMKGGDPK